MRKERVLIAGGVTEAKNGFYRRDDSVHITVNQNKIIRKLKNLINPDTPDRFTPSHARCAKIADQR